MIRDRIAVGIRNTKLSEKLQLNSDLTLAKAVTQVRQLEAVKIQQPLLRGKPDTPVGEVERGGLRPNKGSQNSVANSHKSGRDGVADTLPMRRLSVLPRTRSVATAISMVTSEQSVGQLLKFEEWRQALIQLRDNSGSHNHWTITLTLKGKPVTMHIDTGAEVTDIPQQMWKSVGPRPAGHLHSLEVYEYPHDWSTAS